MNVIIKPGKLSGSVEAINSKSVAHRTLMIAALADQPTKVLLNEYSKDILVTIDNLKRLGVGIKTVEGGVTITPSKKRIEKADLDLVESGSTLRFMLAFANLFAKEVRFDGSERLCERPLKELVTELQKNGLKFSAQKMPFTVTGELTGTSFSFEGDVSSQYITAILMACSKTDQKVKIQLLSKLESRHYVDITLDVMKKFGVTVVEENDFYEILPSVIKSPGKIKVEGDWSNAAFFLVAGALRKSVEVKGLDLDSAQGDKEIIEILKHFGAQVIGTKVVADQEKPIRQDISQIPDLVPILSILLANKKEESNLLNGKRLRMKESDRLISTREMIVNLGANAMIVDDGLVISGPIIGGMVDSYNDHRIVMAAAIASVIAQKDIKIIGAEAVNKSYPRFFEDFEKLGGQVVYDRK